MPISRLGKKEHKRIYYYLCLTRYTDEVSVKKYKQGRLQETVHSCMGKEAVAIGSGIQLRADDYVLPSLRARGYFFVKGISSNTMMAGLYGKATGPARGKNTSHHMGDMKRGVVWGTGVIGSSIPVAVGVALGVKMAHRDSVVMTSFGDGASSRGDFHESLNMAAVWKLPVIFVCENNGWAMSTPKSKQMAIDKVSIRAGGYGMPGVTVDGDDVTAVYDATEIAIERARRGEGPSLIECVTHRWGGHHVKDAQAYRDLKEVETYTQYCPIARYQRHLLERNIFNAAEISEIEEAAKKEVDAAVVYAEESAYPPPEIAATNVYA
jgi:TPP-dependent pyruvate/acetoin dehydrogenase alpha subunit